MFLRRCLPCWLLSLALLAAVGQAAEPQLKTAIVTAARVYDRQAGSISVGGVQAARGTVTTSRVTVALEGVRITGEWEPKTTISTTAKDFPRGSDVRVAVERNRLLLEAPDGSIVTAKIVKREQVATASDSRD
jgi:hypothetical protein